MLLLLVIASLVVLVGAGVYLLLKKVDPSVLSAVESDLKEKSPSSSSSDAPSAK